MAVEKGGIRETLILAVANSRIIMTGDVPKKKAGTNKCFGKRRSLFPVRENKVVT